MVKMLRIIITLASIATLTACGMVKEFFEDPAYELPPTELVEFTPEFEPKIVWSVDTGGTDNDYSDLAAWIQGEMIVAVDNEGEVSSYDVQSGRQLWQTDLDVPVTTGVGGGDGLILIGTQKGEVIALDETTGVVNWRSQLSSEVLAPPKAALDIVVARTSDGRLSGISATDGHILWNYQRSVPLLSLRGASAPVLADDKVISGFSNGKLAALSIIDGTVVWEQNVSVARGRTEMDRLVDVDADPVVRDGNVYAVAYHGQLASFDLASGQKRWSRDMSSRSGLDVDPDNAIYVTDEDGYVWALQDGSGDALWRQTRLLRRKVSAPIIAGEHILVGDFEGYVHWISREDGHFVARKEIADGAIRSKPIVKDGLVFITGVDGTLTAIQVQ
jgi:outer membrane protein assembly factor BamB